MSKFNTSAVLDAFSATRRRFLALLAGTGGLLPGAASVLAQTRKDSLRSGPPGTSGRIDIHHHIVPDFYVQTMQKRGVATVGGVPFPKWSPQTMLDSMGILGVRHAVVSVSAPGVSVGDPVFEREFARQVNEYSAALVRDHAPRIGAFATIPTPSDPAALDETRHALDRLGLDGVCLFSSYDGKYLGDPAFVEYLDFLNQRDAVVFIHPTLPLPRLQPDLPFEPPIIEFVFDTTRTLASLLYTGALERFPRIRFIVAHLGGTLPFIAWRLRLFEFSNRESMRRYREQNSQPVSHYLSKLYYDVAVSASPGNLQATLALAGPDRLLFGSDVPFAPQDMIQLNTNSLRSSGVLDEAAIRKVEYGNAARLFQRFSQLR